MPVTMNAPISWKNAKADDLEMLKNLQPNILKPHTRDFLSIIFLKFSNSVSGRAFLREVSTLMKSTKDHLDEIESFKNPPHTPGTPYVGLGLTAAGYAALGISPLPGDG